MTRFTGLLALALLAVAPPTSARAQDVDAAIRRAQHAWANVRTARATFEQTITNPITGSAMVSRGELQQRKPNRLSIRFTDPAGEAIVADGEHVWLYLPSATPGQVVRMTNAQAGAQTTDLIGQFLDTPRADYEARDAGADTVSGRAAHAIVLTARPGKELPFIRAKVWVDDRDGLIRRFESTDRNGISRTVRLLSLRTNVDVDDALFRFRVPDGVRVVTP